jgi:hypothetical protein
MTISHAPATWDVLDGHLAEDEQVWVELRGRDGRRLIGTDRRLIGVEHGRLAFEWPWEEVDDVAPVGGRAAIRIRRADRAGHVDVEPVGDPADVMQAVTILALLAVDAARYGARLEELRRGAAATEAAEGRAADR